MKCKTIMSGIRICLRPLLLVTLLFSAPIIAAWSAPVASVWSADPGRRQIALTFDDGPHPRVTSRILDVLGSAGARATFFVLGERIISAGSEGKSLLMRMADEGHEIGNHSMTHPNIGRLSSADRLREITRVQTIVREITGSAPRLFRPPGGNATFPMIRDLAETDIKIIVMWSIDTNDWKEPGREAIWEAVRRADDGAIILMHDTKEQTLQALPLIVDLLQARGFALVTVSELLGSS